MLDGPVTVSAVALAVVTVKDAGGEVIVPELAVMLVVPAATPKASPEVGELVLMVATPGLDEVQLTLPLIT
jgi:hypothetical protein